MRAVDVLETPRLVIRRPTMADAGEMFGRYASDAEATRLLSFACHTDVSQTEAFVSFSDAEWARWPAGPYVILSREDGRVLGGTGFSFETRSRASIGYVLARDAWGKGLATEALGALVDLAPELGVQRLWAICHPSHRASANVLRKCGFVLEGTLRCYAEYPNLAPGVALDSLSFARVFSEAGTSASGSVDGAHDCQRPVLLQGLGKNLE
jgi:ribosomal-protein-alanine N-acetyltransferase